MAKEKKIKVYHLYTFKEILDYAYKHKYLSYEAYKLLRKIYILDPHNWHKNKKDWQYFLDYKKKKKHKSKTSV